MASMPRVFRRPSSASPTASTRCSGVSSSYQNRKSSSFASFQATSAIAQTLPRLSTISLRLDIFAPMIARSRSGCHFRGQAGVATFQWHVGALYRSILSGRARERTPPLPRHPRAYARGKRSVAPIGAQEKKPTPGRRKETLAPQGGAYRQLGARHFLNPRRG
jgi:hypothetical protein